MLLGCGLVPEEGLDLVQVDLDLVDLFSPEGRVNNGALRCRGFAAAAPLDAGRGRWRCRNASRSSIYSTASSDRTKSTEVAQGKWPAADGV